MRIEILPEARDDLIAGFRFYEHQALSLGSYFRESILSDVDALAVVGGVHALPSVHLVRCAIENNASWDDKNGATGTSDMAGKAVR